MKKFFVKVVKIIGYILAAIVMLWAAKSVFITSVDDSQRGDNVEHIENQIP